MDADRWFALALLCLLGAAAPGPSLAVIAAATLGGTRRTGVAAALAHATAVTVYALASVSGLALLLAALPMALDALRLAGAAYLAYLGLRALRSRPDTALGSVALRRPLRDGFLIAFLNPKLALFMLALFSQFLAPAAGWGQRLLLVATAGCIDALWYTTVVLLLDAPVARRRLATQAGWLSRVFGLLLLALAAAMTWAVLSAALAPAP